MDYGSMSTFKTPPLPLLSNNDLTPRLVPAASNVNNGSPACSPTIDLVAFIAEYSAGECVYIWRTSGQVVHRINLRYHQLAQALCWKPDGQFLAIAWDDGYVRLVGLENSKAVHQILITDEDDVSICYIAWAKNHTAPPTTAGRRPLPPSSWSTTFSEEVPLPLPLRGDKSTPNLPRELTFLEVDTALPKISPLPMDGGSGEDMFVFTTKSSLEFIFPPLKPEDSETVNIMIVGTTDGRIHITIYDSFVIGSFDYHPPPDPGLQLPSRIQLFRHASHPATPIHSLLFKPTKPEGEVDNSLVLVPLDLRFVTCSPLDLSLLASKTTTFQNLIRYLKQAQEHISQQWQSTRDLPGRFLRPVKEDLQSSKSAGPTDIVPALYHSVLTGHMFPVVKEWLVDIVAERGHKRWDKAVVAGLQNLRSLIHENFLPVLDRTNIVLSRLLGLAKFHGARQDIGFTAAQISHLSEVMSCLSLVANKILLSVMDELSLFAAFSAWMRFEIDKQTSSNTDDLLEKEAAIDHARVLAYIPQYLAASPIAVFLEQVSRQEYDSDTKRLQGLGGLFEILGQNLRQAETGGSHMKAFPQVKFLVEYLSIHANDVFGGIAEAEKKIVQFGLPSRIDIGEPIGKMDIKVQPLPGGGDPVTFIAMTPQRTSSDLHLIRAANRNRDNTPSTGPFPSRIGLSLGEGEILDVKFLDDSILLVLWLPSLQEQEQGLPVPLLLKVPYTSPDLKYSDDYGNGPAPMRPMDWKQIIEAFGATPFEDMHLAGKLQNVKMEVIPASTRRGKMPVRVCALEEDSCRYKIWALP